MRHAIALPVVACTLAFAGCANQNGVTTSVPSAAQLATVEAEAATYAKVACGFVPTASTIAGIAIAFATKDPDIVSEKALAEGIASSICSAVTAKSAKRGGVHGAPKVGGVTVHGEFSSGRKI